MTPVLASRRSPAPRPWAVCLLALGLVAGACVHPFKPADPEPPDASGVVEDFSTYEAVLQTIALAIQNRSVNGVNAYAHAFAESTAAGERAFRAFYDQGVRDAWQRDNEGFPAPEPWDLGRERNVHSTISGHAPSYTYAWSWQRDDFSPNPDFPVGADTGLVHQKYVLIAIPTDGNPRTIAIGYAALSFQFKEGRWSIFRWVDRVDLNVGVNPADPDQRTMSWWRLESLQ